MRIADRYGGNRPVFSSEFFPPKTEKGFQNLYATVGELKRLSPDFVSVTWGAGSSTRTETVDTTLQIQQEIGGTATAHLSCIGSPPDALVETLDQADDAATRAIFQRPLER